MLNQVLLLFVGVFAVIGLITSLYTVLESFSADTKVTAYGEFVMFVRNCEDEIEGMVRRIAGQLTSGLSRITADRLCIVDCGSSDETIQILSKLQTDIDIVKIYTKDEYIEHINQAKELI